MILEYAENGDMKHAIDKQKGAYFDEAQLKRDLTRVDRPAVPGPEILPRQ